MTDTIAGALIGGAVTFIVGFVPLFIYIRQTKKERAVEDRKIAQAERDAMRAPADLLYKDLGSLIHLCSRPEFDGIIKQIDTLNEKQRRGEYNLSRAPLALRQFWTTSLQVMTNLRLNAEIPYACYQDKNVRTVFSTSITSLAQGVQATLHELIS